MKHKFGDDATMDEFMRKAPAAIRIVLQHGMLCVGCPIARFTPFPMQLGSTT